MCAEAANWIGHMEDGGLFGDGPQSLRSNKCALIYSMKETQELLEKAIDLENWEASLSLHEKWLK